VDSNAGLGGLTSCITLANGENNMTVDAGVVLSQPISCEGLVINPASTTP